jgi:hypothetical protein
MTQDIIEMAKQAGFMLVTDSQEGQSDWYECFTEEIEAFAKLVEAHTRGQIFKPDWDNYRQGLIDGATAEREACATVCDDLYRVWTLTDEDDIDPPDALDCKRAIRSRGEQQSCDKHD